MLYLYTDKNYSKNKLSLYIYFLIDIVAFLIRKFNSFLLPGQVKFKKFKIGTLSNYRKLAFKIAYPLGIKNFF